jgi:hypothetical protein
MRALRKLNRMFTIDSEDLVKFSSKFLGEQTQEEQTYKLFKYFLHSNNQPQLAIFNKPVISQTETDYLFEKNFMEVYEKNFLHQAYRVQNASFDNQSTSDSRHLDESLNEIEYHGEYVDEDIPVIFDETGIIATDRS